MSWTCVQRVKNSDEHAGHEKYVDELKLHADRALPALVHGSQLPWLTSSESGVERRLLERIGGEVALASSIVRYQRGSHFARHTHDLGEEFFVLEGTFSDGHGDYPAGSYVRNPPGTSHAPFSESGCVIFVKLRQMRADDNAQVWSFAHDRDWCATSTNGHEAATLHNADGVSVTLERLVAGTTVPVRAHSGGEEIFVITGSAQLLDENQTILHAWSWSRRPGAQHVALTATTDALLWINRGHLPAV